MCDKVSLEKKIEKVEKKLNNKEYSHLINKDLALAGLRAIKFINMMNKEE